LSESEFQEESLCAGWCSSRQYYVMATCVHILAFPLKLMLCFTIPDCRLTTWRRYFWITFTLSCLWIAIFSYLMIWMITIIGHTLGIPDTVMGLTLIAAGSSVPDAIASVLVVREGQGDMAVSNAVGSNVFDILLCMGLPWFLQTVYMQAPVYIYSRGLLYATFTLLSTVVILLVSMQLNRWRLTKPYGIVLLVVYFAYLVLCTLYELNVFGQVHPSECPLTD
jgi:Ca2+/Na+ antiporter